MLRNFSSDPNQIYHIFNRGTEKRKIFLSRRDYERFFVTMALFNSREAISNPRRYDVQHPMLNRKPKEPLVDILCFCLMPNHFHLVLRQRLEGGISKYLQRLQMGYSKYFNLLYERTGNLFQGAYKVVEVERQNQFQYLPLYVHMNPLELIEPKWEKKGVKNIKRATKFLEEYPWSSLKFYSTGASVPFLKMKIISSFYRPKEWRGAIKDWLEGTVQHPMLDMVNK